MTALFAAIASLAVCAIDVVQRQSEIAEAQAQLGRWQQRAVPPRRSPLVPATSERTPQSRSLQALRNGTRHPWPLLFIAVESVGAAAGEGSVAWLALEHERERGDVRIEGVAKDAGQVLKIVDGLAAEPGWSQVVLTRLAEADRADGPNGGLRFEIAARLGGAAPSSSAARGAQP